MIFNPLVSISLVQHFPIYALSTTLEDVFAVVRERFFFFCLLNREMLRYINWSLDLPFVNPILSLKPVSRDTLIL